MKLKKEIANILRKHTEGYGEKTKLANAARLSPKNLSEALRFPEKVSLEKWLKIWEAAGGELWISGTLEKVVFSTNDLYEENGMCKCGNPTGSETKMWCCNYCGRRTERFPAEE